MSNEIRQTVEGIEYENLKRIAEAYEMNSDTLYKRFSRGKRGDDLVPRRLRKNYQADSAKEGKVFKVGDFVFKSAADACRRRGIGYGVYRSRLRCGWSQEEALGMVPKADGRKGKRPRKRNRHRRTQPLVLFGREFGSYKDLEKFSGVKDYVLWQRVNTYGMSLEEALLFDGKNKPVVVEGRRFDSTAAFARAVAMPPSSMYSILSRFTPKDVLEGTFRSSRNAVSVNGKTYPSLKALAADRGMTTGQLSYRLKCCKGDLETAIGISGSESVAASLSGQQGHLYIAEVLCPNEGQRGGDKQYKIGVTQHVLEKRYSEFPFPCKTVFHLDGELQMLQRMEKNIKAELAEKRFSGYSARDFDGFSELFSLNDGELQRIKFMCKFGDVKFEISGCELEIKV